MKKQRHPLSKKTFLHQFEQELIKKCDIDKACFHKVRSDQWENIYKTITEKFADKTKTWKKGLHWANTNGYSPKSMKNFKGCYPVDYSTWFFQLPEIIPEDKMVYFLIDQGSFSSLIGYDKFWIFEGFIPELIRVLDILNHSAFLDLGWLDYYIVSKKFEWIIGFNHHDIVSFVGNGLNLSCFNST